ncbi:haloacid dehalogenase [Shewanella sp. NFH-SH190041]|uniref:HAD-IA family hydrolase n=1 Tax=Shewanella sp. NFH-SH190041 TaxID=2950245 RepID=UPI0021C46FAD|nr:HAD-IA family hydrolase [Shewanella sp. NFH-SH190041]BDM62949.1 haloacid dehalogenase [Shewanella sp. NFH-SH190041]
MKCYLNPGRFSVLSFDLDDTLYDNRPIIRRARAELASHLASRFEASLSWQDDDWLACRRLVVRAQPELAHDTTACREAVLVRALSSWGYQGAQLRQGVSDAMACFLHYRSDFTVADAVVALLAHLGEKYRLIAITNGNVDVDAIGLGPYFQMVLHPGHGVRMKPATDMFLLSAQRLRLPCADIAHIGDSWRSDVQGSRQAGCKSIWLNPGIGAEPAPIGSGQLPHLEIDNLQMLNWL